MDIRPIPAYYCCYLLRSTVRPASVYVGSTPHPARRLGQHNGESKGGAVRTSRLSLRPWEMSCIVAGFPSNIAALQFEWAWHNAHLTRHIQPADRLSFPTARTKTNSRTGKTRRKPGRPRTSLLDKLSNLHLLLRAPYFSKWPLEVRFFSEDAYRSWQTWCERVDTQLRPGIKTHLDLPQKIRDQEEVTSAQPPAKRRKVDLIGKGGVDGVDPTYAQFQDVLEKSKFILDADDGQTCDVCTAVLDSDKELFFICPNNGCRGIAHITCMSTMFLERSGGASMVPETGPCLSCGTELQWANLMREVSLRARGQKEVQKLLSKKRKTKVATAAEILETESEDDEGDWELAAAEVVDEEEESENDAASVVSAVSCASLASKKDSKALAKECQGQLEIVIEDSDDER